MKCKFKPIIYYIFLIIYIFFLIYILFFKGNKNLYDFTFFEYLRNSINLIPFKTICEFIFKLIHNDINTLTVIYNLIGNILIFIPLGFFIPSFPKQSSDFKKTVTISFLIILSAEISQLVFMVGYFDIDDIILNLTGVLIGYFLYKNFFIKFLLNNPKRYNQNERR